MNKTLYIKINNNSLAQGLGEELEVLDCRCINDFCSMVGDALIGDLKDSNGTPLYRLINPAGEVLSDFENVDKGNYDLIITQWFDILGEILHKGVSQCNEQFTIRFPQQYTDWLLFSEIGHYAEIGKSLQTNDGKVYLDTDGISEYILSSLHAKIERFVKAKTFIIDCVVFSNKIISPSSNIANIQLFVNRNIRVAEYNEWTSYYFAKQHRIIRNSLNTTESFTIDGYVLGKTFQYEIHGDKKKDLTWYKGGQFYFENGIWNHLYVTAGSNDLFNHFLSILLGIQISYKSLSYNEAYRLLIPVGFIVKDSPYFLDNNYFRSEWQYESDKLCCTLTFWEQINNSTLNIEIAKKMKGTLYAISIKVKANTNKHSLIDYDDDWDDDYYYSDDDGLETILGSGHILF